MYFGVLDLLTKTVVEISKLTLSDTLSKKTTTTTMHFKFVFAI